MTWWMDMPKHRFSYTVSGISLTDAQKAQISEEIAAAVTRVIVGDAPELLNMAYSAEHPICGGSHRQQDTQQPDGRVQSPPAGEEPEDGGPANSRAVSPELQSP
jgi:hypothetical protein